MRRLCLVILALLAPAAATAAPAAQPPPCPPAVVTVKANAWNAARHRLVPPGPVAIRLCRYAGLNARPPLALERALLVTSKTQIARLAREYDALPPFPPGLFACPFDDGSQVLAQIAYPGGRRVMVAFPHTGCLRVTNGDLVRMGSERLDAELWGLTAPAHGDRA